MPTFNSIAELERYVQQRMVRAIVKVRKQVYDIIYDVVMQYYGEYTPVASIRTGQLANSLTEGLVKTTGNGAEAEIYFDVSALSHPDSYMGKLGYAVNKRWSEEEILSTAMTSGTHGGTWTGVSGIEIWGESLNLLNDKVIEIIKRELIAAGIPIR